MGTKNYRPTATGALLETLRKKYWDAVVEPMLKSDGAASKQHIIWNLYQAGCKRPYPNQLLRYMVEEGEVEVTRMKGHLHIRKSSLSSIPKFKSENGGKRCQK